MSARFNHNRVLKETIEGPYSGTKSESDAGGKWGSKLIYVYGFVYTYMLYLYLSINFNLYLEMDLYTCWSNQDNEKKTIIKKTLALLGDKNRE